VHLNRPLRSLVLATGIALLTAAPAAAAPTWLPSLDLSTASPSGNRPSSPQVASDAAGETFAAWIRNDGQNDRVQVASHAPGLPWSPAADLSENNQNAAFPSLALSASGFGALAWSRSDGVHLRVQVSRRAPGGGFGAAFTVSDVPVDSINPVVAVDAAGDVVVIWEDSSLLQLHSRRYTESSNSWGAIEDIAAAGNFQGIGSLALVMSSTGMATAAWSFDAENLSAATQWQVQTRSEGSTGTWTPMVQLSNTTAPDQSAAAQLAVDDAGNVTVVWSDYRTASCGGTFCIEYVAGVVRQATRSAASGVWSSAATLSDPNLISDGPRVATTPAGEVTVAWTEQLSQSVKVVTRAPGGAFPPASAATIITPNDKLISSSGAHGFPQTSLRVAAGPTGAVASFARSEDGDNFLAEAVYKPAGAAWPNQPQPVVLSPPGVDIDTANGPNLALDGLGNAVVVFANLTTIRVAALDVSPPAFTAVDVPASGITGQPVALSAGTVDVWSALGAGQPSWSFGDGATGAGPTVSHAFAKAGTYTVTVGVSDAVGNAAAPATRQIVITDPAPPPPPAGPAITVKNPRLSAVYRASKLVGSIVLTGTSPIKTTLTIAIRRHGAKKNSSSSSFAAKAGTWTRTLKLPTGLTPGTYEVTVAGTGVTSAQTSFAIAAPKTGIVKHAYATGPKRGPAATTLVKTSELWAHFQFSFLPKKKQAITTQWILPDGSKLAANTRPRTTLVEAQVKDLSGKNLPTGRWRCVITVGKTVVATLNVRLK
jgi:PKD domain